MALSKLDFQQARIKQVLFKSRLRSVLYGVREADASLLSMAENPFGQWLATVVKPLYNTRPEVRALEQTLQATLDAGQALVAQYQRGQIEEARTGLSTINDYADKMEELLQSLEKAIVND
jgi:hypothetical protein